jgi:glycosyltransferase involved in cell wall biosynthesis
VGWQWLRRIAREHDVTLLTHAYFREQLEPALAREGLTLDIRYVQAPAFGMHPHRQLNSRLYYVWWQMWARLTVRRHLAQKRFDLIHHLTWGTLRFPCLLGGLGVPLVMGPLGGGEAAPMRLFAGLPLRDRLFDAVRAATLAMLRVDPLAMAGPRRAALVLCKSQDSLRALPPQVQARAAVMPEIGSPATDLTARGPTNTTTGRQPRLLFAGRLLGWKGVALALGAVDELAQRGVDVHLDIAGDGPLRPHLEAEIVRRGLQRRVALLGMVPRDELLGLYGRADLFLFPSLHDSSGNVVLEALSRGLPVVCLDLGGPQLYIDESCGVVVSTAGRDRAAVEQALADAIGNLLTQPARLAAMSKAAAEHAARQSWDAVVARAYAVIEARIGWASAPDDQSFVRGAVQ